MPTSSRGSTTGPAFIPGLELNRAFYGEVVAPILRETFPGLAHSAARLGQGSDVLGYDTPMSMDHGWGPRIELFLSDKDHVAYAAPLLDVLARRLPRQFRGFPVAFTVPDASTDGSRCMDFSSLEGQAGDRHLVSVQTVGSFLEDHLGVDARRELTPLDWLSFSEQRLLELTRGAIYHDGLGELEPARRKLAYHPRDVWLFRLASQWRRIAQEEPFVGRCGDVGDDLGSRVVAARMVRELMRLCLLMGRRYAPYSKWLGTEFSRLACYPQLEPLLARALRAEGWPERQAALAEAYEEAGRMHNALGVTPPVDPKTRWFYGRPFRVLVADRFADATRAVIEDPWLRGLPLIGGADEFCDSTDVTSYTERIRLLRTIYGL